MILTKHKSLALHILTAVALHVGIGMTLAGDIGFLQDGPLLAQATSTLSHQLIQGPVDPIPFATAYEHAASAKILVLGILFIVLGGFLHARWKITHDNTERPVRVTEKRKQRTFFMAVKM